MKFTDEEFTQNPYAAPEYYDPIAQAASSDDETFRKAHINHEASVKSVGLLFYIGAIIVWLIVIGVISHLGSGRIGDFSFTTLVSAFYLVLGALQLWIGWGLRKLNRVGRIGTTIFAAIGLLAIPLGTLISAYILYLMWSEKGNVVFSDHYKEVIAATPHVRYKTSIIVWILVIAFLTIMAIGVVATIFD